MSMQDQNSMLQILHKNGVSRRNIVVIMRDLEKAGIFDDYIIQEENEEEWGFIEEEASILFGNKGNSTKINKIRGIRTEREKIIAQKMSQYFIEQEKRIQAKQQELIKRGEIEPDVSDHLFVSEITTRFGRNPLQEAIAMKDLVLVEKYIKQKKYLNSKDNNGHTAMEMAYYEGYKEALDLFAKYDNKRKT